MIIRVLILSVLINLCCSVNLRSQSRADSLLNLLNKSEGIARSRILSKLNTYYQQEHQSELAEEVIRALHESFQIDKSTENNAILLKSIGIFNYYQLDYDGARTYLISAEHLFASIPNHREQEESARYIYMCYEKERNFGKALHFAKLAQQISDREPFFIPDNNESIAAFYQQLQHYDSAEVYYNKSLQISKLANRNNDVLHTYSSLERLYQITGNYMDKLDVLNQKEEYSALFMDSLHLSEIKRTKADFFYFLTDYEGAISLYFEALKLADEQANTAEKWRCLVAIGNFYSKETDYEAALLYYRQAQEITPETDSDKKQIDLFLDISNVLCKQKKYTEALNYVSKASELGRLNKYEEQQGFILSSQAKAYRGLGRNSEALQIISKAIEYHKTHSLTAQMALDMDLMAQLLIVEQHFDRAMQTITEVQAIADSMHMSNLAADALHTLASYYQAQADYKKAIAFLERFQTQKDSLTRTQVQLMASRLRVLHETDRKERDNKKLRQENQEAEITIRQQYSIVIGILSLMSIGVLFTFLLYRQKRFLAKANRSVGEQAMRLKRQSESLQTANLSITQQKEELMAQAEDLNHVNSQLRQLSTFKEALTSMLVHDLKNPLNIIINKATSRQISNAGRQMHSLVQNILDVYKFEDTSMVVHINRSPLAKVFGQALEQVDFLAEERSITISYEGSSTIETWHDEEILMRIFINLLTNAIKYSPQNGKIIVSAELQETEVIQLVNPILPDYMFPKVLISVTDQGMGIPRDQQPYVFNKFTQVNPTRSGIIRSTGIGLTFCKLAVEAHGGEIGVNSEEGEGASFWFSLALAGHNQTDSILNAHIQLDAQTTIKFTTDEKIQLKAFAKQFSKLEVFDTSEIEELMDTSPLAGTPTFKQWRIEIEKTIYACNQERFITLGKLLF